MKYEKSCGAIVFRKKQDTYEFLIIHHRKGGHWDFPKGHVEKKETEEGTAIREVYEETGLRIDILEGFRQEVQYSPKARLLKTVVYFLARALSEKVVYILPEVDDHKWVSIHEALSVLTFDSQKDLLTRAYNHLLHYEERN